MKVILYVIDEDGENLKEGFKNFMEANAYRNEQMKLNENSEYFIILEESSDESVIREINLTELSVKQVKALLGDYGISFE